MEQMVGEVVVEVVVEVQIMVLLPEMVVQAETGIV
jgi:hypothetical protein